MKRLLMGMSVALMLGMPRVSAAPDQTMSFSTAASGVTITASEHCFLDLDIFDYELMFLSLDESHDDENAGFLSLQQGFLDDCRVDYDLGGGRFPLEELDASTVLL